MSLLSSETPFEEGEGVMDAIQRRKKSLPAAWKDS